MTGLAAWLGVVRESARLGSLGVAGIFHSNIDPQTVYGGVAALLSVVWPVVAAALLRQYPVREYLLMSECLLLRALGIFIRWSVETIQSYAKNRALQMLTILLVSFVLAHWLYALCDAAPGLILKSPNEIEAHWGSRSWRAINQHHWLNYLSRILIGGFIGAFALSCGWLCWRDYDNGHKSRSILFGFWAAIRVAGLLVGFAGFFGDSEAEHVYPVVVVQDAKKPMQEDRITILVAQDDREYALLVLSYKGQPANTKCPASPAWGDMRKEILYVPRSEVDSLSTLGITLVSPFGDFCDYSRVKALTREHERERTGPITVCG